MAAQGLAVVSTIPSSSTSHQCSRKQYDEVIRFSLTSSFMGAKLSINRSGFNLVASNRRHSIVAAACALRTTIEGVEAEKMPKWSAKAIRAYSMATYETLRLEYPKTSSEALLAGIMIEGTNEASEFLRANGFTVFEVKTACVKARGRDYMYISRPSNLTLTENAQKAIDWAVEAKMKSGDDGEITTSHLLLGIWSVKESVGHKVLAQFGFDDEKAKELAKKVNINIDLL